MGRLFVVLMLIFSFGWGEVVRVATSANASYVVDDLIREFRRVHPKIKVQKVVSSSGKLTAQIIHKAPYDIFLSADMKYPQKLYKMGLCSKPRVYAKGLLAIFSKRRRDFKRGLEILEDSTIKRVAIANPKLAPYGEASVKALKSAGIYDKVESKFIFGDSISQTLSYTLKVADIGLVAKSLLLSPKMSRFKERENWVEIDKSLYDPIEQGAVLLKASSKEGRLFFEFLFSKDAKEILKNFGYSVE